MEDISKGKVSEVTLTISGQSRKGHLVQTDTRTYFLFSYWKALNEEVKSMSGGKYHGYDEKNPAKLWSVDICARNWFALDFLQGRNPYARYDSPLDLSLPKTALPYKNHQIEFAAHIIQRRTCIIAAEMGTGKTLPTLGTADQLYDNGSIRGDYWYIAPASVLRAIRYEYNKWKAKRWPRFMTYEELVKTIKNWKAGDIGPQLVVFDESSRIKTPTSQRSKAAFQLAEGVRNDWGENAYVVLLSGTPAPRTPIDWWHQAEVAQPGFLKEGNHFKLQQRLAVVKDELNPLTNTKYPSIKAWRDDENKCNVCGLHRDNHLPDEPHNFVPSINEVKKLYSRLSGLVLVRFKKDCLDLPEKIYRTIKCPVSPMLANIARTIKDSSATAMEAMVRLRELSDGFQYIDEEVGSEVCSVCNGSGSYKEPDHEQTCYTEDSSGTSHVCRDEDCEKCRGTGTRLVVGEVVECTCTDGRRPVLKRKAEEISCPKHDVVNDLLDEHSDVGRIVFFAGFTASIDKIIELCHKQQWYTIRVDGRGWEFTDHNGNIISEDPLISFQDLKDKYTHIAFVAHPGSGGMGLTLTASPTLAYYSNDFNAESRIQSEDRIHRQGMDVNRGATIIDIVHLPTDELVIENLKKKRALQALTLGEVESEIEKILTTGVTR